MVAILPPSGEQDALCHACYTRIGKANWCVVAVAPQKGPFVMEVMGLACTFEGLSLPFCLDCVSGLFLHLGGLEVRGRLNETFKKA